MNDDGAKSYALGHAAIREIKIRKGEIFPSTPTEFRWAEEGPVDNDKLEILKCDPSSRSSS